MFQKRWLAMALLFSYGAQAEVSFEEKQNRVEYLEELSKQATSMNIEAYRRELVYEKQGLSAEDRAANEANLLAEKMKNQIGKAFDASMEAHGDAGQAIAEIREAIEKDLELADPNLREDLKAIAFEALENVQKGSSRTESSLSNVENVLLKGVKDRMEFLNVEGENDLTAFAVLDGGFGTSVNKNRDSERKSYNNKNEILSSLVSDRESIGWISGGGLTLKSTNLTRFESKISLQVKVAFLGVEVEAGPQITFKREYNTNVNISAEGMNPILLPDGNFDFNSRDRMGRVIKQGNQDKKRLISFACEAQLDFESDYAGEGGFSFGGLGGKSSVSKKFINSVNLTSRRIALPEYVANKTMTYKNLAALCHNDFLNARVTNNLTVAGSLNVMMKNVVASLRFSHPKTKCATDNHCVNWYNREVIPLVRLNNYPRCAEESREKYRACVLRGLKGQNCAVFDKTGKRISDGMFEFACDKGLRCVQYKEAGWFKGFDIYQYAKGKCMPTNPKTYVSPLAKIIYVDLK